ncbi:MAG: hypothetical protein EBX87_05100 [Actinobacteria bacterium]|nr:hypothetical protein [Actinomycetota bacterium]
MNFAFTEEQEELRKTVRAFLDSKSPETAVRAQMETEQGFDKAVWDQMGSQMGLMGLHIPEEFGGMGFSYVELGVVLEEMGRALLCAPYFSTVAAYYGMWCASEMNDELASVASLSKAYCSEAYFHAAAENIQIHGGIGFTWEHPAHLYFKRAKSSELLFGDPAYHREQLAQRIGI